jgi:general secretion pathway protein G
VAAFDGRQGAGGGSWFFSEAWAAPPSSAGGGSAGGGGGSAGGGGSSSQPRKDRFLVPINSDYDLYSMGPDGASAPPLTAKASHDDIIRASDGAYVGVAENF